MAIGNEFLKWVIIIILAYVYGAIVQAALKYERGNHFMTLSIGIVGILIGKYLIGFMNLSRYLYIASIPVISSLIGSFIIPGIMWFFRQDKINLPFKKK